MKKVPQYNHRVGSWAAVSAAMPVGKVGCNIGVHSKSINIEPIVMVHVFSTL